MPLYAISLEKCSAKVQQFVVSLVFSEWRSEFMKNDIRNKQDCLAYFLGPEKGQLKNLYVAIYRDTFQASQVIGTVGISTKDFNLHISNLFVLPQWRRKGFGKQLLVFAENRCKSLGLSTANLWCDEDLVSYYEDAGWLKQDKLQVDKDKWVQTLIKLF